LTSQSDLSLPDIRRLRMRAQWLEPRAEPADWLSVVRDVCGINAQLPSAMALALRARVKGLTAAAIEAERVERRSVVRTWCMRSTLHLLAAEDLEWLLSTLDPGHLRGSWRWLLQRAGLDDEQSARVVEAAVAILRDAGPLPRRELMLRVSAQVGFDALPAAAGAMLAGGLQGRIGFGPDQGSDPTYADLATWLGRPLDVAHRPNFERLIRRYLKGYGPANPADLAAWWGSSLTQVKQAWTKLEGELLDLKSEDQPLWILCGAAWEVPAASPRPIVRLIPAFDTYLLGYQDRAFAVAKSDQVQVFHGGQIAPVVLVDGLAEGTWRYEQRGGQMRIAAQPFRAFSPQVCEGIAAEAEDIGRFYGLKAVLSFQDGI
jgi:hypothetical protein